MLKTKKGSGGHKVEWDFGNQSQDEQADAVLFPVVCFLDTHNEHKGKKRKCELAEHQQQLVEGNHPSCNGEQGCRWPCGRSLGKMAEIEFRNMP